MAITDEKIQYLQMIQEVISRMSTISSVIKGFAITIITTIIAVLGTRILENCKIFIFLLLLIALPMLDAYYLQLERKYRTLYEDVRLDKHPVDFCLSASSDNNENIFWKCICSKCILGFYIPIFILYLIICVVQ